MTETPPPGTLAGWTDLRIMVAIGLGLAGLAFNAVTFCKQRSQGRRQAKWDEYRETVYDPLSTSLAGVEALARRCARPRNLPQGEDEWKTCLLDLSERLNDVEIACEKADSHQESARKDWSESADAGTQTIHDLISDHGIGRANAAHDDNALTALRNGLQAHVDLFQERLRDQRKKLLNF